jgi:hypothetical protein
MKKIALVIGIDNYEHTKSLSSAVNDAEDMHSFLGKVDFETTLLLNATQKELIGSIASFKSKIDNETIALIYFAGHGLQVDGDNFLVPSDANVTITEEIPYFCINASDLIVDNDTETRNLNIIILDACRNNPFTTGLRSVSQGLARMIAPVGTLIAFSTSPNMVAIEHRGERNGVYTKNLLKYLNTPNLSVERVFKNTRTDVIRDTQGKQVPWEESSLHGEDFMFIQEPTALLLYLKKELIFAYRTLTEDLLDLNEVEGDDIKKLQLTYQDAIKIFKEQYERYKNTIQPREAFALIFNLQNIIYATYKFGLITQTINFRELDRQIILQQTEIDKTKFNLYQKVLFVMEHYGSIYHHHDRFGNLKTIKRLIERGIWNGFMLDGDFLKKQDLLFEDLKYIRENEDGLEQIIEPELILEIMDSFFKIDK